MFQVISIQGFIQNDNINSLDPLECCDVSDFIKSEWRSECDFKLSLEDNGRLHIKETEVATTEVTTTTKPTAYDVKVVPMSCEQETCVFKKLNVLTESGRVDDKAFILILDRLTNEHAGWTKGKARVISKCLTRPVWGYESNCEINKILSCTFDVLSENCATAERNDPCNRHFIPDNNTNCQINSSKFRPKNRRQLCKIPNLIDNAILAECGLESINKLEYVPVQVKKPSPNWWFSGSFSVREMSPSTNCLLNKMNVLNKYKFMDYFKMKDLTKQLSLKEPNWSKLMEVFTLMPFYKEHISSERKLLNILDSMLMKCPTSRRNLKQQCNKIFTHLEKPVIKTNLAQVNQNFVNQMKLMLPQIFFNSSIHFNPPMKTVNFGSYTNHNNAPMKFNFDHRMTSKVPHEKIVKKPAYDFGILKSKDMPQVETIDIKPSVTSRKIIKTPTATHSYSFNNLRIYDQALRSGSIIHREEKYK